MFPPKTEVIAPLLASILKIFLLGNLMHVSQIIVCAIALHYFLHLILMLKKMHPDAIAQLATPLGDNIEHNSEFRNLKNVLGTKASPS